jgi:hypothetical protein
MTDDLLPDIQPSHAPALESARREMEAAELAYLDADKAEDEFGTPMPREVKRRWHEAVSKVADVERQQMEEAK